MPRFLIKRIYKKGTYLSCGDGARHKKRGTPLMDTSGDGPGTLFYGEFILNLGNGLYQCVGFFQQEFLLFEGQAGARQGCF